MRAITSALAALLVVAALAFTHAVAQEPVTITMWTHDQLYIDCFLERAVEWEQRHPEYAITYDFQQMPDPLTAALTAISARQPLPDLLGIEIGQVFSDVALDVPPLFQSPNRGFFLTALGDNLPLFFEGAYSPEQFLDAVIRITEDEIFFAD